VGPVAAGSALSSIHAGVRHARDALSTCRPGVAGRGHVSGDGAVELVDHTGELELRIHHPRLAGLYAAALRALGRELVDTAGSGTRRRVPVELSASGADTLLADLLNEAIYLAETTGFVADGLEVDRLSGGRLSGDLVGRVRDDARPIVKAATYHGLAVERDGDGWRASVVLDV
jgi:SHS2 domain-containing protein